MKRGTVKDINDPKNLGRIRVEFPEYDTNGNLSPWCWPCVPTAGPGYGLWCVPVPGDEVYVEKLEDGSFAYIGFCWTPDRTPPPVESLTTRKLITPAGHFVSLSEDGNVEISHSSGTNLVLKPDGTIEINGNSDFAVRYSELKSAFDELKNDFNTHTHGGVSSGTATTFIPTPISSADMSKAKVSKVKIP
jgi:hypothetical protein